MIQFKILNVKLSNSQHDKLEYGIKNGAEVTFKFSSIVLADSNENNILHKLLSTNTQVSRFRKAFENGASANIKLSKIQLHKIRQSRGFLGILSGPLLKTGLPLMKNILKPLANHLIP